MAALASGRHRGCRSSYIMPVAPVTPRIISSPEHPPRHCNGSSNFSRTVRREQLRLHNHWRWHRRSYGRCEVRCACTKVYSLSTHCRRLSEDPNVSVAVLEAGGWDPTVPGVNIPGTHQAACLRVTLIRFQALWEQHWPIPSSTGRSCLFRRSMLTIGRYFSLGK